jgi:hypothetical protein
MMKVIYSLLFISVCFCFTTLNAQDDCAGAQNITYLHANNIRTPIDASGSLFWNGEDGEYLVSTNTTSSPEISTVFAHGLWLSAFDPSGNLKTSIASYGKANNQYDYYPGPILEDGPNDAATCANWDKVWSVYRYEIEAHIADWEDNNVIDNPLPAILSWPGRGNPNFEDFNGFELPDTPQGLAPFWDNDADGTYNPLAGDYPIVAQSVIIPDQITWTVFNDQGLHFESQGVSLDMEIQLTSWAFNCFSNPLNNQATFFSYRMINRGVEPLDSLYIGMWTDFDLGCFTDDYIGSAPEQNTYFAYNQDFIDDIDCAGTGIEGFGENPPVQAVTLLNHSLDHFIYGNNAGINAPNPGTTDPETVEEYRNNLQGLFRDGTPISEGGDGYNTSDVILDHAFPGNPNDTDEWSMASSNIFSGDRRALGSHLVPILQPGAVYELDFALSLHREPMSDAYSNVNAMYEGINTLQSYYDNAFEGSCDQVIPCEDDCVWPGDLNADGIANHCDLLNLGFGLEESGGIRLGPYNWFPRDAFDWDTQQINGANSKHLDADGNSIASIDDFEFTQIHYNFVTPDYIADDEYHEGDDIIIETILSNDDFEDFSEGESVLVKIGLAEDIPNLKALAFSIEYDPTYIASLNFLGGNEFNDEELEFGINAGNQFDFAKFLLAEDASFAPNIPSAPLRLTANADLDEPLPSNETTLRFKNIKAYLEDGTFVQLEGQTVTIVFPNIAVSTEEIIAAEELRLFPNPTTDRVRIESAQSMIENIQVLDATGRLVASYLAKAQYQETIDLSAYANGIYFIQVRTDKGITTKKVIKQ